MSLWWFLHGPGARMKPVPPPAPPNGETERERREGVCQRCQCNYPVWFAPNDLWNRVVREHGGDGYGDDPYRDAFLCPTCFATLAETRGITPSGWVLTDDAGDHERHAQEVAALKAEVERLRGEVEGVRKVLSESKYSLEHVYGDEPLSAAVDYVVDQFALSCEHGEALEAALHHVVDEADRSEGLPSVRLRRAGRIARAALAEENWHHEDGTDLWSVICDALAERRTDSSVIRGLVVRARAAAAAIPAGSNLDVVSSEQDPQALTLPAGLKCWGVFGPGGDLRRVTDPVDLSALADDECTRVVHWDGAAWRVGAP